MSTCEARLFVPKGRFIAHVSGMTVDKIFCPPLHGYFVFYCFCRFNREKARKKIVTSPQKGKNWTIVQTYSCGQNELGQCFFANVSLSESLLFLWLLLKYL
jgi:hypothetical protein